MPLKVKLHQSDSSVNNQLSFIGTTVTELGLSLHNKSIFFDSKNHSGFLYIRPTLQCLQNVILPSEPYLIGLLIHR